MNPISITPHAPNWLACPDCEAPCLDRELPRGAELHCGRCGARVKKQYDTRTLQPALAFALAGLCCVPLANTIPILTFDVAGNETSNLIVTGVHGLVDQGYWPVAILVGFSAIIAPALHLLAVAYVSLACCLGRRLPGLRGMFKAAEELEPWNLVAVFAIGTVVAVVKLKMLGTVEWNHGARWIVLLSLCSLFAAQFFDRQLVEEKMEEMP